jgi:hypothetical protein
MSTSRGELLFVYVGNTLPKYARASLSLARETSGIPVRLISNGKNRKYAKRANVSFTAIEDFYSQIEFERAKFNILSNSKFRDGLWVNSLQRFFILYQYAEKYSISKFFHAELDQLLFNISELMKALDFLPNRGLFVPFHSERAAVASVFFCNSLRDLKSLLDYASFGPPFLNEMTLISEWARLNSSSIHRLPTLATELTKSWDFDYQPTTVISSAKLEGIVDAAQLGQWTGGIDPRNVDIRHKPKTKFIDSPTPALLTRDDLQGLSFRFEGKTKELFCHFGLNQYRVYNLHLHSKIHSRLDSKHHRLQEFFLDSNQPEPYVIPGTRRIQVVHFLSQALRKLLENPISLLAKFRSMSNRMLNRRKSSYPFISGDTFRKIANHVWEKENSTYDKLRKAIKYVTKKNGDMLMPWSQAHPACMNNQHPLNDTYIQMMSQSLGGRESFVESENKIMKKIAKAVLIEK